MAEHVAIMLPGYIDALLSGRKRIESRLTLTARAPFRRIATGERIYFRRSCGPYMATAVVKSVEFYADLTPRKVAELRRRYNEGIRGTPEFWRSKSGSRYASIIFLDRVSATDRGPALGPSGGAAWFVLPNGKTPRYASVRFMVGLTEGAIRNGYVRVPRRLHVFEESAYGGSSGVRPGEMVELILPGGQRVRSDVAANGMIRWRGWKACYERWGVNAGDGLSFTKIGARRYRVWVMRAGRHGTER